MLSPSGPPLLEARLMDPELCDMSFLLFDADLFAFLDGFGESIVDGDPKLRLGMDKLILSSMVPLFV